MKNSALEYFQTLKKLLSRQSYKIDEIYDIYSKALFSEVEWLSGNEQEIYFQIKYLAEEKKLPVNYIKEYIEYYFRIKKLIQEMQELELTSEKNLKILNDFLFWIIKWKILLSTPLNKNFRLEIDNTDIENKNIKYENILRLSNIVKQLQEIKNKLGIDIKNKLNILFNK
jgi:hypothetical protein